MPILGPGVDFIVGQGLFGHSLSVNGPSSQQVPGAAIVYEPEAGLVDDSGTVHPFTAPAVSPETTDLRNTSTRMAMGTTATTLAANIVP